MKNAVLQIKKLYGTGKKSNKSIEKVYFIENQIFWTDFDFFYKKELETNILNGFSVDLKNLYNVVKTLKKIESVNVENDILILNNIYKIKLEKSSMEMPENIYKQDLKNQNIVNDFVISDFKEFIKSAEDKTFMSLLHNFVIKPDSMACTDGNRLNIYKLKTNVTDKNGVLLPSDFITKNLNKKSDFYLSEDKKYISCVSSNEIITCKNPGGQYPKFEQLIPFNDLKVKYANKKLLQVLKQIKTIVNKTNCIVFNFNKNQIEYKTNDNINQSVSFNFNMPCCTNFGVIGFNVLFLIDLLQFHDDDVIFNYGKNELSAVLCESKNKTTIIMPIQLRDMPHVDFDYKESEKTATPEQVETVTEADMPAVEHEQVEAVETVETPEKFEIEATGIKSVLNKIKNKVKTAVNSVKMQTYKPLYEHKNIVTGRGYGGANVIELDKMMVSCGYNTPSWLGKYQAKKLGKQVKSSADGVMIRIFYENEDGTKFSKLEN